MAARANGTNPRSKGTNPRRAQLSLVPDSQEHEIHGVRYTTAQVLIGDLLDRCETAGIALHRRTVGQLAKTTKELLEDGFAPDLVAEGLLLAVATNEAHRLAPICQSINLARRGALMDRRQADRKLRDEAEILRMEAKRGR